MNVKVNFKKLKQVIAQIIQEQATCECSGFQWGTDMMEELDKCFVEGLTND